MSYYKNTAFMLTFYVIHNSSLCHLGLSAMGNNLSCVSGSGSQSLFDLCNKAAQ